MIKVTISRQDTLIFSRIKNVVILSLLVLTGLGGCAQQSDEHKLKQALETLATSLENRQGNQVLDMLSSDFRAQKQYSKDQVAQMLLVRFRQNKMIKVLNRKLEINMLDNEADVSGSVILLGSGGFIPERGQNYEFQMRWKKRNEEWKLSRINWQIAGVIP